MPYGLNPAALPFTPQVGAAETQTANPEPVESLRTGVDTKGSVPTSVGRRVIEENRGNTDLDGEEDDSGRGVRPIYNTSLETLEGLLGTQVTRKDRSRTPPEKIPDNKNPQTQAGARQSRASSGFPDIVNAETRVDSTTTCISSWSRRLERTPDVPKSVSIPKHRTSQHCGLVHRTDRQKEPWLPWNRSSDSSRRPMEPLDTLQFIQRS